MPATKVMICGMFLLESMSSRSNRQSHPAGDLVWANEDAKKMIGPLAEIIVGSVFFISVAHSHISFCD